ncbi:4259_t:CDS:2, partial [Funneliformis geosporum]
TNFDDFIKPIFEEIKCLENGLIMQTIYGDTWIVGGNDLAGVKQHSAIHSCQMCNITNNQLTNPSYDHMRNTRFHYDTEEQFLEIDSQHTKIPQDAYHSMAEKEHILLEATFSILAKRLL